MTLTTDDLWHFVASARVVVRVGCYLLVVSTGTELVTINVPFIRHASICVYKSNSHEGVYSAEKLPLDFPHHEWLLRLVVSRMRQLAFNRHKFGSSLARLRRCVAAREPMSFGLQLH